MDDQEYKRLKESVLAKATIKLADCKTTEDKVELMKNRSAVVLFLLKEAGLCDTPGDSVLTITAMAHAAGLNAHGANLPFDFTIDMVLQGNRLAEKYTDLVANDIALRLLAAKPQGQA